MIYLYSNIKNKPLKIFVNIIANLVLATISAIITTIIGGANLFVSANSRPSYV